MSDPLGERARVRAQGAAMTRGSSHRCWGRSARSAFVGLGGEAEHVPRLLSMREARAADNSKCWALPAQDGVTLALPWAPGARGLQTGAGWASSAHGGGGAVAPAVAVPARASRLAPASAPRSRLGRRLLDAGRRIAPRTSTRLARAAGPIRSGRPEPPIDARVRTPNSTNRVGTGAADSDGVRVEPRAGSRGLNPHSAARA